MEAQIAGPLALTGPYSQAETARLLACSQRVVQRLVETGKLRTVRVKGRWMVPASEITRLASSPPAAPTPPTRTPEDTWAWLCDHVPAAVAWWHLWRADLEALRLAKQIADSLPVSSRAELLLLEHQSAERTASLGYLAELISAESRAVLALKAHDVRPEIIAEIQAKRARLAELVAEVQRATEPAKPTKTEAKP